MFYHIILKHEINLHPKYFGPNILETIKAKLLSEVEGISNANYGFIIAVTSIDKIGDAFIQPDRCFALIPLEYRAIVYRPYVGEVIDVVVKNATKIGIFAEAGPFEVFISLTSFPANYEFCPDSVPPCYIKKDEDDQVIQEDDEIRVKIVGIQHKNGGILGVGIMSEDYLGLIV